MSILSVRDVVNAELAGKVRQYDWTKTPTQITYAGIYFDLSMSPGNPKAKYWFDAEPLTAKAIYQSTDGGIFHGANVSPEKKYIRTMMSMSIASATTPPYTLILSDYLLYYPSIDEATTDVQVLDNTITLPRYIDGVGVQIMPVIVGAASTIGAFYVTYTNSDGVAGRTTATMSISTGGVGNIVISALGITNGASPFMALQDGDIGVRSIESVTITSPSDGLFSLILVYPLARKSTPNNILVNEIDFLTAKSQMPRVYDNAYLNFIIAPNGTMVSQNIRGYIKFIWG